LAAQVAARRSTNTNSAGSVENDEENHVVTVEREAPSPVVDVVRSNFQVGEMMRFQLLIKNFSLKSFKISTYQQHNCWGGNAFLLWLEGSSFVGQVLGIR